MPDPVKNFARCVVLGGYSSADTTITLQAGEGAKLPAPATDGAFNVVWWNSTDYENPSDDANKEIVRVTARTTDALTIVRPSAGNSYHYEGSSNVASSKNTGGKVYLIGLMPTKRAEDYNNGITVGTYAPVGAGTTTIDVSTAKINVVTMPAATQTLALSNVTVGQIFIIEIINTTSQGALTWFTTIKWADSVAPTLTGTNGKKDAFGFRCTSAGNYDGYIIGQNI